MKRFTLIALMILLGGAAIAPSAGATPHRQVSSPSELGEDATFIDLVRHNRDVRSSR